MTNETGGERKPEQPAPETESPEPENERTEAEFRFCLEAAGGAEPEDHTARISASGRRRAASRDGK